MNGHFSFKDIDIEGEEILDTIALAGRFNQWMYDVISQYCQGRILEIGSGIGNISQFFIDDGADIVLSDVRNQYCNRLKSQYANNQVQLLDLVRPDFEQHYTDQLESYDTVFALNVIEHIENDQLAIDNINKLLKPSGRCVILVPAFGFLYNSFDRELLHFRRYNRQKLNQLLQSSFTIEYSRYYNSIGMIGWYLNGNILNKKIIPTGQLQVFDALVPLFKGIDHITKQICGLSVIMVGIKK